MIESLHNVWKARNLMRERGAKPEMERRVVAFLEYETVQRDTFQR